MWFLTQHPEVEAKLVDEVLRVMGPQCEAPSYQQLSEMRYLNAVLKVGCLWCVLLSGVSASVRAGGWCLFVWA